MSSTPESCAPEVESDACLDEQLSLSESLVYETLHDPFDDYKVLMCGIVGCSRSLNLVDGDITKWGDCSAKQSDE